MFLVNFTNLVLIGVLVCSGFHNGESASVEHSSAADSPVEAAAKLARRQVHAANWTSISQILRHPDIVGYPMFNSPIDIDDSDLEHKGTGHIYFMLMNDGEDYDGEDVTKNKNVTMLVSEALISICEENTIDSATGIATDYCPRVYLSGEIERVTPGSDEHTKSLEAFHYRHPNFRRSYMDEDNHSSYLAKLNIKKVTFYPGRGEFTNIPVEVYYGVNV